MLWTILVGAAWPCGGGDYVVLDAPLVPADIHLSDWLASYDGYEFTPAPVTRFLYTVHPLNPAVYADLEGQVYGQTFGEAPALTAPSLDAFEAAVRANDRAKAHVAAVAVIDAVLGLPSTLAEPYAPLLRRPIEYLELEPTLGAVPAADLAAWFGSDTTKAPKSLAKVSDVRGMDAADAAATLRKAPTHARAASLRWLALRAAMTKDIPDGWSADDIRGRVDAATWRRLTDEARGWLATYPNHPLADLVRGKLLRLHYLQGDAAAAWQDAVDLHAHRPARAVAEMRFLVQQGVPPTHVDTSKLPLELAIALWDVAAMDEAAWTAAWTAAAASPHRVVLEERLLYALTVSDRGLPDAFPREPAAPSETWARLRLGLLARAGDATGALAQAALMKDDEFVGPIRAWAHLTRGEWVDAIRDPGIPQASRHYLVSVLADDDLLAVLSDDPDAAIAADARLTVALRRRAVTGRWDASPFAGIDPEKAALWKKASKIKDDLQAARFLREQAGEIFIGNDYEDVIFYRSLPTGTGTSRAPNLPFTPEQEWGLVQAWATRSFATYAALERYAAWLDRVDTGRPAAELVEARKVLDEADTAYNLLLNYGSYDSYTWGSVLPDSAPAQTIRRVGKDLRAKLP